MKKVIGLLAVLSLSGCVSTNPYRDSYIRYAETGAEIQKHLPAPKDDSEKALFDSFDLQTKAGLAAKGQ